MTRVRVNPRQRIDKPLVERTATTGRGKFGERLLRGYLAFVIIVSLLGGVAMVLLLLPLR